MNSILIWYSFDILDPLHSVLFLWIYDSLVLFLTNIVRNERFTVDYITFKGHMVLFLTIMYTRNDIIDVYIHSYVISLKLLMYTP